MILGHAMKLYLENPDAAPMAEAMLDATFTALAGIADDTRRHVLVHRAFELAYAELGEP